ncbi:hypothetical protein [Limosilactobacillus reuteri]|uniref:hypothetical protein n=1 Tax=Limosilactobacillus reuteri TaxID=1598 RepID=UPI001E526599|nr:hypothetical protein [Limosilactobacillus reuteri]MCC4485292.1 hypothetical protein [Limosilactobacillus reuteri]
MKGKRKKKSPGFFKRVWSSKKGKWSLIILVILFVSTTAYAANSVFNPAATQEAQKAWIKNYSKQQSQEKKDHPIRYYFGRPFNYAKYNAAKAVNPSHKPTSGEKSAALLNDFNTYERDIAKRDAATGDALARLKKSNPSKYAEIMKGLKDRGMKDGKMPATAKKYLEEQLSQSDPQFKKEAQANNKDINKDTKQASDDSKSDEDSSFKSKIASALLHIFWASGLGKWLEQNGAAGTVFTYNPITDGGYGKVEDADVASQLNDKINNHPSQLMFPSAAYSSKFSAAIDAISPAMYGLAAVMLVVAVIVGATKMGWGQAFSPAQSRAEWYQNFIDIMISVSAIFLLPVFIRMLLQLDGAFLQLFANLLQGMSNGNGHTLMTTCLQLGADDNSINAITKGNWLGDGFAGIIFVIIYLCTAVGLAIWIKFYYFARMLVFIILIILGPIFLAMWPFGFGKARTMNWLRDLIGTIFIQAIQAFTLTLMTFLLWINSSTFGSLAQNAAKEKDNQALSTLAGSTTSPGAISSAVTQITTMTGKDLTVASHFEMLVMGFIILMLFQPVSRGIADLFGIGTNMLDRIHSSTSRTLTTGAAIAGTAALGLAGGAAAGLSSAGHGATFAAEALKKKHDESALEAAKKNGTLDSRSLLKRRNAIQQLNGKAYMQKQKAKEALARMNGMVGPNAGRLIGASIGAGTGNIASMAALSVAGGEIGARAAQLNQQAGGLVKLGLKRANMNRAHNQHVKALRDATGKTLDDFEQSRVDANPGPKGNDLIDQVDNNSKLSDDDRAAAKRNIKAYQNSMNGKAYKPSENAKQQRIQMEKNKDINGNFVPNSDVQANAREVINGLPDGSVYDKTHGVPKTEQEVQAKAQAMGFNYASWKKSHEHDFDNTPESERQAMMITSANKAMNNLRGNLNAASQMAAGAAGAATADVRTPISTNEIAAAKHQAQQAYDLKTGQTMTPEQFAKFKQTAEYRNGLQDAQMKAVDQAYIRSNGGVVAHTDLTNDAEFNNSMIDANRFGDNLNSQLDALNVTPALRSQLLNATEGLEGKSLVQTIGAGHGETVRVINQDLLNQVQNQRAYAMRKRGMTVSGRPVTGADISKIYAPNMLGNDQSNFATPADYEKYFNDENLRNYAATNESQAEWDKLNQITAEATQAGAGSRMTRQAMGLFGFGSQMLNRNPRMGRLASQSAQPTSGSGFIDNLTSSNPYSNPGHSMTMDDVRNMIPIERNDQGEPTGIAPGSLRSVITNNYSMLQAKDSDGNYHTIGNLGPGDGSLSANEQAYQDYDMSPSGELTTRVDPMTHRPTTPYRISGQSRIPVSLPYGAPDIGSYFTDVSGNSSASVGSSPYKISDYMGMPYAPQTSRALANGERVYGDDFAHFTNKEIRGNYDGVVMTGVDPQDGETKVLSEQFDNTIWPGMDSGYEFKLPIHESAGTYVIDPDKAQVNPINSSADPTKLKNLKGDMINVFRSRQNGIQNYINEAVMQPTKPNMHNFISNHPGYESINLLDTFTKGLKNIF